MRKEIRETVATVGVQASGGLVVVTGTRTQQRGDERLAGGGPAPSRVSPNKTNNAPSETLVDDL